ncbi:MAG: gas vesicle protein GvpN [Deltaproteobacteria bacterium]|nr:gas vesicle protein GvpN [Deltaproteobacteria bacterium]
MANGNGCGLAAVDEASSGLASASELAAVSVEAGDCFVATPEVRRLAERALVYLNAGYPVHFSGPAGTGKTTLALHVAALRGRPVSLMHGDDEFGSSDLVGGEYGYRKSKLVDNFIHSVLRTEETMNTLWADNRLTLACKTGDTLVYDEFTRSRPEANNALLSVLEERLLTVPTRRGGDGFLEVHPEFRAIFTSNPEEYAGVHRTQDALVDRFITIRIEHYDRETEVEITRAKGGIGRDEAEVIVDIVRDLRRMRVSKQGPSLRASIMIGRVMSQEGAHPRQGDAFFGEICRDVLGGLTAKITRDGERGITSTVDEVVAKHLKEERRDKKRRPFSEVAVARKGG